MRGKKARKLRKEIYGEDFSIREKNYFTNLKSGQLVCDDLRGEYKRLKGENK